MQIYSPLCTRHDKSSPVTMTMSIHKLWLWTKLLPLTHYELQSARLLTMSFVNQHKSGEYQVLKYTEGISELKKIFSKRKKNFTVAVEGNIGCGKSTLLNYFQNSPTVESLPEPVGQWRDIQGHNLLELLYANSKRWSFTFDNYALLTRLQMHKYESKFPVRMLERSMFSTKYVFIENNYRSNMLADVEYTVLDQEFDYLIKAHDVTVDLFVYLRASPEVCFERLKKRNRKEEAGVPFAFLKALHELHEDWLIHRTKFTVPGPVLVLDASHEMPKMRQMYEENKAKILCGCT